MLKDLFLLISLLTWVGGSEVAITNGGGKREAVHQRVALAPHLRVDNSLVQIWKVNFGHKVKFLFGL